MTSHRAVAVVEPPLLKQVRIKTGIVVRIEKEVAGYQEEQAKQRDKIGRMRSAGGDEHDIKKQIEVLEETEAMIPDSLRRLGQAVDELRVCLEANAADSSVSGTALLASAREVLARHADDDGEAGGSGAAAGGAGDDDAI